MKEKIKAFIILAIIWTVIAINAYYIIGCSPPKSTYPWIPPYDFVIPTVDAGTNVHDSGSDAVKD